MGWSSPPAGLGAWVSPEPQVDELGGVRERQAEFETEEHVVLGASTTRRPDAIAFDMLEWMAVGPVHRSDATAGLVNRTWKVNARVPGEVSLARSAVALAEFDPADPSVWEPEELLFTYAGVAISQVDLAFDQNGAPVVAAERPTGAGGAPEVWLYWFNAGTPSFGALCHGRTPRLLLDDPEALDESDVLLFYVSDPNDRIELRQQRELYATPVATPITGAAGLYCEDVARATDLRLHVLYSRRDAGAGTYTLATLESAPYPLRPLEPLQVAQTIRQLDAITFSYLQEYELPLETVQRIQSFTQSDLVLFVDEDGPDGRVDVEPVQTQQRLRTLAKADLTLIQNTDAEPVQPIQRVRTFAAVEAVIPYNLPDAEPASVMQRLRTFTTV